MKQVKKLWMPLLLGVLLIATSVGVAGARPNARPEASPALVDYMFGPYNCTPDGDAFDWDLTMNVLRCDAAPCYFFCPIKPPHEGLIRVQRLAMYAYDNDGADPPHLCIGVHQLYPKTGGEVQRLGTQCTTDNPADPQVYAYNPPNFKVSVLQDIYVSVGIHSVTEKLYGFKLKYEPL